MRWAASNVAASWSEGRVKPLPVPWPSLANVIKPKGGNTMVLLAAPGVGKTTLLLNWAAQTNARTLFVSSDTSSQDMTAQLACIATGHLRSTVESRMLKSGVWRSAYAEKVLALHDNLVLDFAPRPTIQELRDKAVALTELWGRTPQFIVMDTASNVAMSDQGSYAEWERVWLACKEMARELNAVFCFAHHVRQGPARSGRLAPEASDGLWGSDKFPELVMGLHQDTPGQLTLTVRKNRGGRKDVPVRLDADLARAFISEEGSTDEARHTEAGPEGQQAGRRPPVLQGRRTPVAAGIPA